MTKEQEENDQTTDEEGLRLQYDTILVGTGLVQAILASALARAGKSVLHTDSAEYYGELDAVWTLPYLESQKNDEEGSSWLFHRRNDATTKDSPATTTKTAAPAVDDASTTIPLSPYGGLHDLEIHSMGKTHLSSLRKLTKGAEVVVPNWGRATVLGWQQQQPDTKDDDDTLLLLEEQPAVPHRLVLQLSDWKLANGECARLTTVEMDKIMTMPEKAAQEILDRRSRSFAIDVTPGLIWAQGPAVLGLLQSSVSEYVEFKSLEQLWWYEANSNTASSLQAVPCSKNDVFSSSLLSPMEKRRLMKFLQLSLDYSVAESEAAEAHSTESSPDVDADALPAAWETLNERHLNQGRSLARPQNKSVSASGLEMLQACIRDEMDFEEYLSTQLKLSPKLTVLIRYALALGFGSERMTVGRGMEKLGEHLRSLGRFGKTAFLVPLFGSGELSQAFCRSAAVYGATYLLRRCAAGVQFSRAGSLEGVVYNPSIDAPSEAAPKLVRCSHVVVPENALRGSIPAVEMRVLRRVSILSGKPTDDFVRHAVLLPPGCLENSNHPYTIHGLWFDETSNVTPFAGDCGGCSMLHLTTLVDSGVDDEDVLGEAVAAILNESHAKEIYHVSFSYALYEGEEAGATGDRMHVIHRSQPNLTVDEAFDQAGKIFTEICPGVEFLTLSKEIDNMVKERFGARLEEDDEQVALSYAVNWIQSQDDVSRPLFIWLGSSETGGTPQRLLLPVPRAANPTFSCDEAESVIRLLEEHCDKPGRDPRVYFATCGGSNRDALDYLDLIRSVTSKISDRQLQFFVFTNGVRETSDLTDVGLSGIHVSLFAPDAGEYYKATGLDEVSFQLACDFILEQARSGVSVEVGLLSDHAESGRVLARKLGAKEVHVFAD